MSEKSYIFGNFSHVGRVRTENQDYFGYFPTVFGELFVVCDGVGGHKGGSVASRTAVETIRRYFDETTLTDPVSVLGKSLQYADQEIMKLSDENPDLYGMGTTCVVFLLQQGADPRAWVAHAGDSRLYRIRRNHVEQVTKDHSRVQEMVDHGILTPEQAEDHQDSHMITRSLGGNTPGVNPDVSPVDVCKGDRYIMVTDGVSGLVKNDLMLALSKKNAAPQDFSEELIKLANDLGGEDNSTAQIIDIKTGPKPPRVKPVETGKANTRKLPILLIASIGILILALIVVGLFFNPLKSREIDPFENAMPLQESRTVVLNPDTTQVVFQFDDSLITHLVVSGINGDDVKLVLYDANQSELDDSREYFSSGDSAVTFPISLDSGFILLELVDADGSTTITFEPFFEEPDIASDESDEPTHIELEEWVTVAPQDDGTEVIFTLAVEPSQRYRIETRGAPFTLSVGGADYHLEPGESEEIEDISEPEMILACAPDDSENSIAVPEFRITVLPSSGTGSQIQNYYDTEEYQEENSASSTLTVDNAQGDDGPDNNDSTEESEQGDNGPGGNDSTEESAQGDDGPGGNDSTEESEQGDDGPDSNDSTEESEQGDDGPAGNDSTEESEQGDNGPGGNDSTEESEQGDDGPGGNDSTEESAQGDDGPGGNDSTEEAE